MQGWKEIRKERDRVEREGERGVEGKKRGDIVRGMRRGKERMMKREERDEWEACWSPVNIPVRTPLPGMPSQPPARTHKFIES